MTKTKQPEKALKIAMSYKHAGEEVKKSTRQERDSIFVHFYPG